MRLVDESRPSAAAWEDEGRRIGAALDALAAVVVVGVVPDDAAAVALGIGEVQSRRRRVVVVDLAGDTATLARLVPSDDPHGVSDAFRYGVSLNRLAHRVGEGDNLFVMPSGSESVVDEEIYRNDRWRRLVAGFREVGALMVLVAPASAPALDALVGYTDGGIAVGTTSVPGHVLETAVAPRAGRRVASRPAVGAGIGRNRPENRATPRDGGRSQGVSRGLLIAGGAAVAAVAVTMVFRAYAAQENPVVAAVPVPDTLASAQARAVDSSAAAVAPDTPPIRNPADSALAASYAVEIAKFSTPAGALLRVRDELPPSAQAATFGVVAIGADATLWYRVIAGATHGRSGADSALAALRRARTIDEQSAGAVVSVPFAFRLEQGIAPGSAKTTASRYLARGVPAYALLQDDSTATIYAGAFETADQAALFMTYLRAAGIEPALTYRLGRAL